VFKQRECFLRVCLIGVLRPGQEAWRAVAIPLALRRSLRVPQDVLPPRERRFLGGRAVPELVKSGVKRCARRYWHAVGAALLDHRPEQVIDLQGVAGLEVNLERRLHLRRFFTGTFQVGVDEANRFHAYNWHVDGPIDGNDPDAVETAIKAARVETGQPSLIILNTTIGFGSPNHAGTSSIHSDPLGDEEVRRTRKALGWNYDPFVIPDEVNDHMRGAIERGRQAHTHWNTRLAAYRADYPDEAAALEKDLAGELPDGWEAALDGAHATADSAMATRAASGIALNAAADVVQSLTGGSADLAGSNNSTMKGRSLFQSEDQAGSNIAFGVREHGMGAIANGISVHGGLTPYTATFMIFADYMRPAIRLAALSGYPVIYPFTHDSIGLGEDGPTPQPVAHLMSLRAMPGLVVIRPAAPHETIEAWVKV